MLVDHDHGLRNGIQDRLQVGLAGDELVRLSAGVGTTSTEAFANPGYTAADEQKGSGVDQVRSRRRKGAAGKQE